MRVFGEGRGREGGREGGGLLSWSGGKGRNAFGACPPPSLSMRPPRHPSFLLQYAESYHSRRRVEVGNCTGSFLSNLLSIPPSLPPSLPSFPFPPQSQTTGSYALWQKCLLLSSLLLLSASASASSPAAAASASTPPLLPAASSHPSSSAGDKMRQAYQDLNKQRLDMLDSVKDRISKAKEMAGAAFGTGEHHVEAANEHMLDRYASPPSLPLPKGVLLKLVRTTFHIVLPSLPPPPRPHSPAAAVITYPFISPSLPPSQGIIGDGRNGRSRLGARHAAKGHHRAQKTHACS